MQNGFIPQAFHSCGTFPGAKRSHLKVSDVIEPVWAGPAGEKHWANQSTQKTHGLSEGAHCQESNLQP